MRTYLAMWTFCAWLPSAVCAFPANIVSRFSRVWVGLGAVQAGRCEEEGKVAWAILERDHPGWLCFPHHCLLLADYIFSGDDGWVDIVFSSRFLTTAPSTSSFIAIIWNGSRSVQARFQIRYLNLTKMKLTGTFSLTDHLTEVDFPQTQNTGF